VYIFFPSSNRARSANPLRAYSVLSEGRSILSAAASPLVVNNSMPFGTTTRHSSATQLAQVCSDRWVRTEMAYTKSKDSDSHGKGGNKSLWTKHIPGMWS